MTSEPERTPHGGLQIEVVVPDEAEATDEPSNEQAPAPEPGSDPSEQAPSLAERGRNRVRTLVQRLRSGPSDERTEADPTPDPAAEEGPRAKGFTVLSYREGGGDAGPSIPGTRVLRPAQQQVTDEPGEPTPPEAPQQEAPEAPAAQAEAAEPTLEAPPTAESVEEGASAPEPTTTIDLVDDEAQPASRSKARPETQPTSPATEEPVEVETVEPEPPATEEAGDVPEEQAAAEPEADEPTGLVARLRARIRSTDDEPVEEEEPSPQAGSDGDGPATPADDGPGLLARLRATFERSKGPDPSLAAPGEPLPAPVPTPPVAQAEPVQAGPTTQDQAGDGPGLLGSLKRKLSRSTTPDEKEPEPTASTRPGTPVPTPPVAQGDPLEGLLPNAEAPNQDRGKGLLSRLLRRGSDQAEADESAEGPTEADELTEEPLEEAEASKGLFSRFRRKGRTEEPSENETEPASVPDEAPASEPLAPIELPKAERQAPPAPPEGDPVPAPLPTPPPAPVDAAPPEDAQSVSPSSTPAPLAPIQLRTTDALQGGVPTPPATDHRVEADLEPFLSPVAPAPVETEAPEAEADDAAATPAPDRPRSHDDVVARVEAVLAERENPVAKRLRVEGRR